MLSIVSDCFALATHLRASSLLPSFSLQELALAASSLPQAMARNGFMRQQAIHEYLLLLL